MMRILLSLGAALLAGCVAIATSEPMALIDMDISGSPTISPGGPSVYVDGVYRGNPVDSRFRMWLTAGEHEIGLLYYGDAYLWKETILISDTPTTQAIVIRYDGIVGDAEQAAAAASPLCTPATLTPSGAMVAESDMRDDFSKETKRVIAQRAGQRCSNPSCRRGTAGPGLDLRKWLNVGVAAHITAASPDGPRLDVNITSEMRSSIANAIWLCQSCSVPPQNS